MDRRFLKRVNAQKLKCSVQSARQIQSVCEVSPLSGKPPPHPVKLRHRQRRDFQMISQKDKLPVCFLIAVTNLAKKPRKCRARFGQSRFSNLIAADSDRVIPRPRMLVRVTKKAPATTIRFSR